MALRNIAEIDPQNIRKTIVPLEIDSIKEFFEKKDLFFIINYGKSQVKGSMFLTYISNLDLPCEIDLSEATTEEKFSLIKIYMETRNMNSSDVLKLTVAELILTYKEFDVAGLFKNSVLTADEKKQFINDNIQLFKKWDQFLASTLVFLLKVFPDLNEAIKIEEKVSEINDPSFIGLNVVHLFSVPSFLEFYMTTAPAEEICYFKVQFEEYMFKGKNFFHYYNCEENTFMLLMSAILKGDIKPQELLDIANEGVKG